MTDLEGQATHSQDPKNQAPKSQEESSNSLLNETLEWKVKPADEEKIEEVTAALKCHPLVARLLVQRDIVEPDVQQAFFEATLSSLRPPKGLVGLEPALDLLVDAVVHKKTIGVFGDYDADGVTTASLLTSYLGDAGATVVPRVANRHEGYGLVSQAIKEFDVQKCELLISGDCGTSDIESLELAKEQGMKTIVIDHHTVPDGDLNAHPATVLINPFRSDSSFPFKGLASVGLAFYVVAALRTRLRGIEHFKHRLEPNLLALLDLVAIGSVCDLVPLKDENRILVKEGLKVLAQKKRPGILALLKNAGVSYSVPLTEETIGWKIGPRLNAPGRMGSAKPALDCLLSKSKEEATINATLIEQINQERRSAQDKVYEEALIQAESKRDNAALVIYGKEWESGVVGIVASRLAEAYGKPAVVIAVDRDDKEARGSGRSVGGVNLYDALLDCESHLIRFGGHAAAAGLTLDPIFLESFEQAFVQTVRSMLDEAKPDLNQWADGELFLESLDQTLVDEINRIGPFGKENEAPLLLARQLKVHEARAVGDGSHLKISFLDKHLREVSGIGFGLASQFNNFECVDVLFRPKIGSFRGMKKLEMHLVDIRQASTAEDLA